MATAPNPKKKYSRTYIVIVTGITGLALGVFSILQWSTPPSSRPQSHASESEQLLKSIDRTVRNVDNRLNQTGRRFDSLETKISELQTLATELAELEALRDENHRLRVELIQTTQDLFTLSDANLDLQKRLSSVDARYSRPPGGEPSAVNWKDSAREDLAWGNPSSGSNRGDTDESWPHFIRPPINSNSPQDGSAPSDVPGVGIQLPANHPSTNSDCRACHATPEV